MNASHGRKRVISSGQRGLDGCVDLTSVSGGLFRHHKGGMWKNKKETHMYRLRGPRRHAGSWRSKRHREQKKGGRKINRSCRPSYPVIPSIAEKVLGAHARGDIRRVGHQTKRGFQINTHTSVENSRDMKIFQQREGT